MPVHLLETPIRTFLNAAHTLCLPSGAIHNTSPTTFHSTSTPSMFDVFTVNMLHNLHNYLLTY